MYEGLWLDCFNFVFFLNNFLCFAYILTESSNTFIISVMLIKAVVATYKVYIYIIQDHSFLFFKSLFYGRYATFH